MDGLVLFASVPTAPDLWLAYGAWWVQPCSILFKLWLMSLAQGLTHYLSFPMLHFDSLVLTVNSNNKTQRTETALDYQFLKWKNVLRLQITRCALCWLLISVSVCLSVLPYHPYLSTEILGFQLPAALHGLEDTDDWVWCPLPSGKDSIPHCLSHMVAEEVIIRSFLLSSSTPWWCSSSLLG